MDEEALQRRAEQPGKRMHLWSHANIVGLNKVASAPQTLLACGTQPPPDTLHTTTLIRTSKKHGPVHLPCRP